MFLVPLLVCSTRRDETPKVAMDDGSGKMLRSCHLEIAEGASGVHWEMIGYWEDGTDSSWLSYFFLCCHWVGRDAVGCEVVILELHYVLAVSFVWCVCVGAHCHESLLNWAGNVGSGANSPSADVVCPQDPHPSRAHPTEWEVKKGLYIYPKWSMYLPMIS